jgi:hypothetical protein
MIQEQRQKLKPPLAKPDAALRDVHLNRRPRMIANFSPKPPTVPPPPDPKPEKPPAPVREFFCRTCDRRASGAIPAGWWRLNRHVVRGSLPPPWERSHVQPFGLYCSLVCLLESLPRLELIEADLVRRGVGLRKLAQDEQPPVLPKPVTRGGPQ